MNCCNANGHDDSTNPYEKDTFAYWAWAAWQAALAQPAQEPVAWMVYTQDGQSVYVTDNPTNIQEGQRALPLFTAPPQRPWVGLTDDEDWEHIHNMRSTFLDNFSQGAVWAEARLKEKNNG